MRSNLRLGMQNIWKIKLKFSKIWLFSGLILLSLLSLSWTVAAQTVTQGYQSDVDLQRGMVVSLSASDPEKVEASSSDNQDKIHGVVVASNDSTFTLSDSQQKTFVATVGRYEMLVSTEGGVIQPGDFLAISSLRGIAKRANDKDSYTVGKATELFDGQNSIFKEKLTDSAGQNKEVAIRRIIVDVGVGPNPLLRDEQSSLPHFLKSISESIAGKKVSAAQVYISLILLIAASGISGSLLFSGIRSAIAAIGRNPLSKKPVTKSVLQIIFSSLIIFLIGLFGVYLILRL